MPSIKLKTVVIVSTLIDKSKFLRDLNLKMAEKQGSLLVTERRRIIRAKRPTQFIRPNKPNYMEHHLFGGRDFVSNSTPNKFKFENLPSESKIYEKR